MNEIMNITSNHLDGEEIQTVNGRDIHAALEVGQEYTGWVKNQIVRARLVENISFVVITNVSENPLGGRPKTEYHFALDAAKNIAMMSNSSKGGEVRDYFIACEAKLKAVKSVEFVVPKSMLEALRLAVVQAEQIEVQQAQLAISLPKAEALDLISKTEGSITVTEAAKDLQLSPSKLTKWLVENDWIYKQGTSTAYMAYQRRIDAGLMDHRVILVERVGSNGVTQRTQCTQARVTSKGLTKLAESLTK